MVLWAASVIGAELGIRVRAALAPEWGRRAIGSALIAVRKQPPAARGLAIGLLTTLLPCGWLYTFVVVAASAGSTLGGMTVMLAFWAGTVPLMLAVGAGATRLLGPFARRLPVMSAIVVLVLGLLSIAGKLETGSWHGHGDVSHRVSWPGRTARPGANVGY